MQTELYNQNKFIFSLTNTRRLFILAFALHFLLGIHFNIEHVGAYGTNQSRNQDRQVQSILNVQISGFLKIQCLYFATNR